MSDDIPCWLDFRDYCIKDVVQSKLKCSNKTTPFSPLKGPVFGSKPIKVELAITTSLSDKSKMLSESDVVEWIEAISQAPTPELRTKMSKAFFLHLSHIGLSGLK